VSFYFSQLTIPTHLIEKTFIEHHGWMHQLVALMFNLFPMHGTHASLILAGIVSVVGVCFSLSRMAKKPREHNNIVSS